MHEDAHKCRNFNIAIFRKSEKPLLLHPPRGIRKTYGPRLSLRTIGAQGSLPLTPPVALCRQDPLHHLGEPSIRKDEAESVSSVGITSRLIYVDSARASESESGTDESWSWSPCTSKQRALTVAGIPASRAVTASAERDLDSEPNQRSLARSAGHSKIVGPDHDPSTSSAAATAPPHEEPIRTSTAFCCDRSAVRCTLRQPWKESSIALASHFQGQ
eukprot:scaffold15425_cov110-Isochrysis_galbana.AAC.4